MQIALILCYPLLVHLGTATRMHSLQVAALAVLAAAVFYQGLKRGSGLAWALFLALASLCALAGFYDLADYALYLPPVIVPALLFSVFVSSLLPGRTALVTAIGEKVRGPLSPSLRRYTRGVTRMWCLAFAAMALGSALLPWLASKQIWSLFTNILNYIFVGLLFVGEFIYRRHRFPTHEHPSFCQYIRIVIDAEIGKRSQRSGFND